MSFLLDTNVLSELRKPHCNPGVRAWFEGVDAELFISVLCVGEIRRGIELKRRTDLPAATALVHGLTLVTRNTRDLERSTVALINPFEV